jgi:hypothetical protein
VASKIKIKRSSVANKVPTTSDIDVGELAINTKDQKLYSSNGTAVFTIGSSLTNLAASGNATITGTMTASGIVSGLELTSTLASGDEGGQVNLAKPPNATTNGGVTIDAYQNKVRIFEQGGSARGVYIDLTAAAAGVGTNLLTGGSSTTQYLQVANAVATYQTKAVERAALANTNSYIATQASRITLVNTNLLGTNTAIRALDAQKLSVANATTLLAAKATWSGLTSTNTALRTLISDRLQVANAAAVYQTKTVERAALANTNSSIATQTSRITLVNTNLTGTNTALRTLISDRLQVANASTLYATKSNPTTSGLLAHTGRATISTNLAVSGNTILSGTLVANSTSGTAGYYLRTSGTGVYWSPVSGGGANGFSGILVGANVISADSTTDRLTFIAGSGITLAANPTTDTITISSSASGASANVVTKTLDSLKGTDTVVTSVSGVVINSGITTGKAIAMAIVFGG